MAGILDLIGWPKEPEARMITDIAGIERPGANMLQVFGLADVSLPTVTIDNALQVPAVLAAVTFLARELAALPLHVYRNSEAGAEKVKGGLQTLIHEAPNAEWTSFKLRQYMWTQVFTGGRGLLWIERSGSNITGLYPLNPAKVKIARDGMGRTRYELDGGPVYPAADIIDVPFLLKQDGLGAFSPIVLGTKAIQLALAMNNYGSTFFAGGGVPPLAVEGPMESGPEQAKKALAQINQSIKLAQAESIPIARMPPGYKLSPIGFDPDKGQMVDARRFQVEEIARVYGIPPVFLQDLSHGTYSNAEQQDLNVVKHLIAHWVQCFEEELNLKLFGQRNGGRYVEHNVDGLLRGDFATRMSGLATAVQNSILTPDEARALENRPAKGANADKLFMQGATVPIDAPQQEAPANAV